VIHRKEEIYLIYTKSPTFKWGIFRTIRETEFLKLYFHWEKTYFVRRNSSPSPPMTLYISESIWSQMSEKEIYIYIYIYIYFNHMILIGAKLKKNNGLGPHFWAAPPLDPSCSETMDPPLMTYVFLLRLMQGVEFCKTFSFVIGSYGPWMTEKIALWPNIWKTRFAVISDSFISCWVCVTHCIVFINVTNCSVNYYPKKWNMFSNYLPILPSHGRIQTITLFWVFFSWIYMIADERARKIYIFLMAWFLLVQNWNKNGLGPHFWAAPPLDSSCSEIMDPRLMTYFFLLRLMQGVKFYVVSYYNMVVKFDFGDFHFYGLGVTGLEWRKNCTLSEYMENSVLLSFLTASFLVESVLPIV
jgi:hypothetical protein